MSNTVLPDINTIIERAESGFELGLQHTGGELSLVTNTPEWAREPSDTQVAASTSTALDLVRAEKENNNGYRTVVVKYSEMLTTPGLLGRVFLLPGANKGMLPFVIMPDSSKPGTSVKFIKFNSPFNPETGLTEGQLLALSFETMAKEQAGFGAHNNGIFEGGHFTVAALASSNRTTSEFLQTVKHAGAHQIIGGSVVTDLSSNRLMSADAPRPTVKQVDLSQMPANSAITLFWTESMVASDGKPARANHNQATKILVGDMISNLGPRGLERVAGFVVLASQDR